MQLYTKIAIALILGVVAGLAANILGLGWLTSALMAIEPAGSAWIRLITMVVVPLVVASLIVGTASLGDVTKLGRIGGKTIAYYLATTAIAVSIGLLLSNLVSPGSHMDPAVLDSLRATYLAEGASRVEIALVPERGGTRVSVHHTDFGPDEGVDRGWPGFLGRLQSSSSRSSSGRPSRCCRKGAKTRCSASSRV